MVQRLRRAANNVAFYHLPNGRAVTLEVLVLWFPLQRLFSRGIHTFHIDDIRMQVLFEFNIVLSWKQVRDALYRVDHGKLMFKHVGRGNYSWRVTQ